MEYGTTGTQPDPAPAAAPRRETETKQAFKTTEFWVWVLGSILILLAGTIDDAEGSAFGAEDVWLYFTLLSAAYMLSRGIAKAGAREPYDPYAPRGHDGLTDRVRAAAQVLREGEPTQTHRTDVR